MGMGCRFLRYGLLCAGDQGGDCVVDCRLCADDAADQCTATAVRVAQNWPQQRCANEDFMHSHDTECLHLGQEPPPWTKMICLGSAKPCKHSHHMQFSLADLQCKVKACKIAVESPGLELVLYWHSCSTSASPRLVPALILLVTLPIYDS